MFFERHTLAGGGDSFFTPARIKAVTGDITSRGNLRLGGHGELVARAHPGNPPANSARLYVRDNGSGLTQLVVHFADGDIDILGQEAP